MFGCFTRNIYVPKICLHFMCAFEFSHDSFEEGKEPECRGGLVLPFREAMRKTSSYLILCSQEFLWSSGCSSFDVVVRAVGESRISDVFLIHTSYSPCAHNAFPILQASICTYKQCLQRNTFTGVNWLVHNYPYLKWHWLWGLTQKSVSDPSYDTVHWQEYVEWFIKIH